jgi:Bacterial membrane protein YfhO
LSARDIAFLLGVLALLQGCLWLAARLLGLRLPARVAAIGVGFPLLFLSPWLLTSRLLVPSDVLATAIPGAVPSAVPDPHALLNDVVYQLLPWELEVRHALSAARLPLWSDALEGGSSPWLNPQSGALSPIAFLSRPLPIQHHLAAGLALKMTIALEGVWLLARVLGTGSLAAALGGLGFALSGGIQAWALLPPSAVAAWAPWVALAALRIVRSPRRRDRRATAGAGPGRPDASRSARFGSFGARAVAGWRSPVARRVAVGAVLVGCLALSGNPEVAAFSLAVAAVWAVLLARRPLEPRALGPAVLAAGLGIALAAPVLVPFLERLPSAQRLDELGYMRVPLETMAWSPRTWFLPRDAPLLEAPLGSQVFGRPYGGLFQGTLNWAEASAGYAGLVALAGAALAVAGSVVGVRHGGASVRAGRRRALPFVFTSLVGLVLAAGFLPLRAAVAALPGAGLAATGRLLPLVVLGIVVAGALGVDALLRGRLPPAAVAAALAAVAALAIRADPRAAAVLLWIALAAAALGARRAPRVAAAVLASVLVADLAPWALYLLPRGDTASFYPQTPAIATLRREAAAPGGPWRATGEDLAVYPSLLPVYGLDEPRPHNPLAARDYARVLRAAFGFAPARSYFGRLAEIDHPLLDFLNVRSVVSYSTRPGAPGFRPAPATLERIDAGEHGTFRLLRNRDALPRVFVPTAAEALRADQIDDWIARLRDPRRVAIEIEEVGEWRPSPRRFDPRAVEVIEWRPGRIELRLGLPGGGLVATSIPGPDGWRARGADGDLETLRVNGAFLGIRAPPGVDRIALGYRPPGFVLGSAIGVAALAMVAALLLVDRPRLGFLLRAPVAAWRAPRPRAATVAAVALAIYLGASLARETMVALHPYWLRGPYSFRERSPARWRLASAPVKRLEAFLDLAAERIPDGSRVAFAGESLPGTEGAYRVMWAAYFLPRHHVLPAGQAWDGDYWVSYRVRLERPDLELMWENEDGAIYRARR